MKWAVMLVAVTLVFGAGFIIGRRTVDDLNFPARYGPETGLPANCAAYVSSSINGFLNKEYGVDGLVASLERNCGKNGVLWNNPR